MSAKQTLIDYCKANLLTLDEAQFEAFGDDAAKRPLSDYNVGQVFTLDGVHYLVPNPPSATRAEFHALRAAWQQEDATE